MPLPTISTGGTQSRDSSRSSVSAGLCEPCDDEDEQDAELADVEEPFGLLDELRTDEIDEGKQHDDPGARAPAVRQRA